MKSIKNILIQDLSSLQGYESYIKEHQELYKKRIRVWTPLLFFLSCVGYLLAYLSYKEHFLAISRILVIWQVLTISLLFVLYNKKMTIKTNPYIIKNIAIGLTLSSICFMIYMTGGSVSPYYAGLILIIIGVCQVIPYNQLRDALIECSFIILCYIATVLIPNHIPFNFGMFLNNLYFMILSSIIGLIGVYQFSKSRIEEFKKRYELKEINRQKTEYYARVNHEIRTPLAMIISPLERLIDENDKLTGEKKIYLLNVARNNSLRLLGLANDLLEMVRLEQAQTRDKRVIDLSFIIGGIVRAVEYMFAEQGHIFNYVKPDAPILLKIIYNPVFIIIKKRRYNKIMDIVKAMLDDVYKKIISDNIFEGMEELFNYLKEIRINSTSEEWDYIVKSVLLKHPIKEILFEVPFTKRCFNKPRGYSGDAVVLDMVYKHKSIRLDNITDRGKKIYEYTSNAPASKAVRYRKKYQARLIDEAARLKKKPNILSVACGHLREIEISEAVKSFKVGNFTGIDQDAKALEVIKKDYSEYGITLLNNSVIDILKGKCSLKNFDLIYAGGLYDYLSDKVAEKLTHSLFKALATGGKLLIANFATNIKDIGYMESYMNWNLIFRDKDNMIKLIKGISKDKIQNFRIFIEQEKNIFFLEVYKA